MPSTWQAHTPTIQTPTPPSPAAMPGADYRRRRVLLSSLCGIHIRRQTRAAVRARLAPITPSRPHCCGVVCGDMFTRRPTPFPTHLNVQMPLVSRPRGPVRPLSRRVSLFLEWGVPPSVPPNAAVECPRTPRPPHKPHGVVCVPSAARCAGSGCTGRAPCGPPPSASRPTRP